MQRPQNAGLLCYITDRRQFAGDEASRRRQLLQKIAEAAKSQVDYIQLREKDLPIRELETLAREAVEIICSYRSETTRASPMTALLINSRTDVALVTGSNGVHLRADDVSPAEVRQIWAQAKGDAVRPIVGMSCHSSADIADAERQHADFALFAPVFEKPGVEPKGLDALRQSCRLKIPVLALGGVTLENAAECLEAGAAGLAGIRFFQENDIAEVVRKLRGD